MIRILIWIATLGITAMMLIFPTDSVKFARDSLELCADTVIPSLFPFFVCSGLLIYSGFCKTLATLTKPVMKPFFNVNENGSAAFILGIISGYPLGAVTACQLYESGYLSKYETERLLAFCNNSGPLFIMGAMGVCMYKSSRIGLLLYASHLIAALTVGVIFRFYKMDRHHAYDAEITPAEKNLSGIYSLVMQNSLNSIITVCGSVIFFGTVSGILSAHLPVEAFFKAIFISLLEMTGGIKAISSLHLTLTARLLTSSCMVGFAGICVHLQVMSVVSKYNLSLAPYIFGKVLHGILSAVYLYLLLKLLPVSEAVFAPKTAIYSFGFYIASILVCLSVIYFLILYVVSCFLHKKRLSSEQPFTYGM